LVTLSQAVALPAQVAGDVVQVTAEPMQQVVMSPVAHIGEYAHGGASIASITVASLDASPVPASRRCRSKLTRPHAISTAIATTRGRTH
jgi:hypothetical protein